VTNLRVIAGAHRGRRLRAPRGDTTRPTSARVREAVFSILGDLEGARVLDLYAGSGALGIEALSRGARAVTFVEHDRAALACIRENLAAIGPPARTRVLPIRVSTAVKNFGSDPGDGFDLVLCDPPWEALEDALVELGRLGASGAMAADARVVVEHAARDAEPSVVGLFAYDRRRWGDAAVSFFRLGARSPFPENSSL
jgi:16S rRNA (guanine(966)-N(2))-methyltransferase RsmD